MNIYSPSIIQESKGFSGSETWYKHGDLPLVYTDGVKWLLTTLECYWLLNDIALFSEKLRKNNDFITVKFTAKDHYHGELVFEDGNDNVLLTKKYEFADLLTPKESIRLFFILDGGFNKHVLLLPSEY